MVGCDDRHCALNYEDVPPLVLLQSIFCDNSLSERECGRMMRMIARERGRERAGALQQI